MRAHELDHLIEGVLSDDRIGIENEEMITFRLAQRDVVRASEPNVILQRMQFDLWEFLPHHPYAIVLAVIINDEYFP